MGVWIDTDMGVDDLFAVLLTLQHLAVDGLSLSFGNATLDQVARNAAGAAQVFGWKMPIYSGADRAILGGVETAQHVLGTSGLPTRGATLPAPFADFAPALPALTAWLTTKTDAQILALGPLTNLAALALSTPHLLRHIESITWMGGARARGNHTSSAEFNAFADPEALSILLARNVPIRMVDLEACRRVEITESDVKAVHCGPNPLADLLGDLLGGYLDIALSRGRSAMALYDPVAAAALVRPDLFSVDPARLDVELSGQHNRGRTIVDQHYTQKANATLITDLDANAVRTLCLSPLIGTR